LPATLPIAPRGTRSMAMTATVHDNAAHHRFELKLDGAVA
jgi:hypothetical protein